MSSDFAWFLLKCFYLMIPAYMANMAPVIVKKINFLAYPFDFNQKIAKKPILGKNKTFRGIFFGVIFGLVGAYIQFYLYKYPIFHEISIFDYSKWLIIGFLMGFGALIGDAVKSFFKRRIGIKPGHMFVPFDQTDFVVGALSFLEIIFDMPLSMFITCIAISFFLHIIVNHIAFYLKIRNEKW